MGDWLSGPRYPCTLRPSLDLRAHTNTCTREPCWTLRGCPVLVYLYIYKFTTTLGSVYSNTNLYPHTVTKVHSSLTGGPHTHTPSCETGSLTHRLALGLLARGGPLSWPGLPAPSSPLLPLSTTLSYRRRAPAPPQCLGVEAPPEAAANLASSRAQGQGDLPELPRGGPGVASLKQGHLCKPLTPPSTPARAKGLAFSVLPGPHATAP